MHQHGHGHCHHGPEGRRERGARDLRRLAWSLLLVLGYLVAEVVGGWLANSLALLADAGHMLSDAAALALSLFAIWIARRPADPRRTYGYHRAEILAAMANGATLIAISIVIFIEAAKRIGSPPEVQGLVLTVIAIGGLGVNVAGLWILSGGRSESLNVRGAWLHMLTDALGSMAAILAGLGVWAFGWNWVDPVASIAIGILVIHSAWALLRDSVSILMESTPAHLDLEEVRSALLSVPGTREVHALHIWTITSGLDALSAHVVIEDFQQHDELLSEIRTVAHERFNIDHVTIQLEPADFVEHQVGF